MVNTTKPDNGESFEDTSTFCYATWDEQKITVGKIHSLP